MPMIRGTPVNTKNLEKLLAAAMDVTGAVIVEVTIDKKAEVLWVNVNGVCVLRVCQIQELTVDQNGTLLIARGDNKVGNAGFGPQGSV